MLSIISYLCLGSEEYCITLTDFCNLNKYLSPYFLCG